MPRYKKKITSIMDYENFKAKIDSLPIAKRAFLTILFFTGCRVSEALALTSDDINYSKLNETIYVQIHRLKGSRQTDALPLPYADALIWICNREGKLFSWCRKTGYNIVKSVFPILYPHYFRLNRFTNILDKHGAVVLKNWSGLSMNAIDHYIGKVDIRKVGDALHKEINT